MTDDETDGRDEPADGKDDENDLEDVDAGRADDDAEGDDEQDDADVDELKVRLAEAEAEAARYKRRLVASDLRKKQVEKELRELRGSKQTPKLAGEDKRSEPDEQQARENADLKRQIADLKVRDAFNDVTKYEWQNAGAAYRLLDLSEVRNDDGTVDRDDLADAIDDLAKRNPYLVKSKDDGKRKTDRPTGQQPGAHRRDKQQPDHKQLEKTFPALRGRISA